jgi:hypothetical protein
MGEKYSPEKLAAMKSVGFMKGGRTRHTDAGSILKKVEERYTTDGEHVRETTDVHDSVITEHQDGRQDVDIHPDPIVVDMKVQG